MFKIEKVPKKNILSDLKDSKSGNFSPLSSFKSVLNKFHYYRNRTMVNDHYFSFSSKLVYIRVRLDPLSLSGPSAAAWTG